MFDQILAWLTADLSGLLVQLFFIFTILLMIFDKQKPPIATSILTGIALIVLGLGGSYHATVVSAMSVVSGLLWLILSYQRFKQGRPV